MNWIRIILRRWCGPASPAEPPEIARARQLIAAIDAGGIPLDARRVRAIAEALGLEVSSRAPLAETVARIRAALRRHDGGGAT